MHMDKDHLSGNADQVKGLYWDERRSPAGLWRRDDVVSKSGSHRRRYDVMCPLGLALHSAFLNLSVDNRLTSPHFGEVYLLWCCEEGHFVHVKLFQESFCN